MTRLDLYTSADSGRQVKPVERSDTATVALTLMQLVATIALCWAVREVRAEHAVTVSTNTELKQISARMVRALSILEDQGLKHE